MKTHYILLAFAILAASGCAKDAVQNDRVEREVTITAWQEGAPGVKSTLQDGGTQVYWEPGDAIKVFYDKVGNKFESSCTSLATVSDFTGKLGFVGGGTEDAAPAQYLWGLYPFRTDATSDGTSVTTTLPATQTGKAGSFAQNTNITLARSEGFGMAFYNVCGGIRFTLSQSGIKRITLEGNNGEALAGTFKVAFNNGVPAVQSVSEPSTKITLKAPGDEFQTGVWYYIACLPGTLSKGFKMSFRSEAGVGYLDSSKPVSIKRGVFGSIANADAGATFSAGGDDPEDITIDIDGEFWDWGSVTTGLDGGSVYKAFKVHNDNSKIYFYSKRDNREAIWNKGAYYYYYIDADNDPSTGISHDAEGISGVTMYMYFYPFAGSYASPEFFTSASGGAKPSSSILESVLFAGAVSGKDVELETSLPLSVAGIKKGDTIALYTWGNKDGSDFKKTRFIYTVK
ncbi:MAG: hypothetical protein IK031_06535 [Bacteroidales bacterium]|nr:hypothetical protein [Bacteroidales bacterium]